jgi:hypothetical protein
MCKLFSQNRAACPRTSNAIRELFVHWKVIYSIVGHWRDQVAIRNVDLRRRNACKWAEIKDKMCQVERKSFRVKWLCPKFKKKEKCFPLNGYRMKLSHINSVLPRLDRNNSVQIYSESLFTVATQILSTWWWPIRPKHVMLYNDKRRRCWNVNVDISTKFHKRGMEWGHQVLLHALSIKFRDWICKNEECNTCRTWRLLTMVCNSRNYWVSALGPSSRILITRKHNVSETGSVSVLRWGEADIYSVGFHGKS